MTAVDIALLATAGGNLVTVLLAIGTFIRAGHVRDDTREIKRGVDGISDAREAMALRAGTAEGVVIGKDMAPDTTGHHQSS